MFFSLSEINKIAVEYNNITNYFLPTTAQTRRLSPKKSHLLLKHEAIENCKTNAGGYN